MDKKYKSYKDLNESSIGKWAEDLDQNQKIELTQNQVQTFLTMKMVEKDVETDKDGDFAMLLKGWNGVALIYKRLLIHTFRMSKAAMVCCGNMVASPGEAVMMVNYIQYRCFLHKVNYVDMDALSTRIIPMGWFSQETLREFWEKQKYVSESGHLVNMLDNPEYGLSIRRICEQSSLEDSTRRMGAGFTDITL